jgi:hypothetical protein
MIMTSKPLDFAYDTATFEEAADQLFDEFHTIVTVVGDHSSGGGWPVVVLTGEWENVVKAVKERWQSGDEVADAALVAEVTAVPS